MNDHMDKLDRVVAVINGKGGVGKTSVTANLAAQLADAGVPTLAVDLDLSGDLALELGYMDHPDNDQGKGLVTALWDDQPLPVIAGVRDGLDVVPGGTRLKILNKMAGDPMEDDLPGGGLGPAFALKLTELAPDYDVVFIDGAPGNPALQDLALRATRYVLIPTKSDAASWLGMRQIGPHVKAAREHNPKLSYLGVVLFAHQSNAHRVLKTTRAHLDEVADTVPMFDTFIRNSQTAAHDCRVRGQVAHELARDAKQATRERIEMLRTRRTTDAADGATVTTLPTHRLSGSANSLAGDYRALAKEVLERISQAERAPKMSTVGR